MIIYGEVSFIMFLQKTECKTFLNQSKPKVNDSYEKNEEITANYELSHDEDVVNKAYLDTDISKVLAQTFAAWALMHNVSAKALHASSLSNVQLLTSLRFSLQVLSLGVLFGSFFRSLLCAFFLL